MDCTPSQTPNPNGNFQKSTCSEKSKNAKIQASFLGTALIGNPYYGHQMDTATSLHSCTKATQSPRWALVMETEDVSKACVHLDAC